MNATESSKKNIHHGRNIKRFREMFGMKQEALALELGDEWSQKKVSRLEEHEVVEEDVLEQVAKVLKIPKEAIKNFNEEAAINVISNTVNNSDHASGNSVLSYYPTFNPIDKLMELVEENKKLYEQLLASEREKVQLLQRMLDK